MGRKKRPYYRIVAVDSRKKRDGAFIERVGYYHPLDTPATVVIEADKALKWLRDGAIPSDTVLSLFRREGVWLRFRLEKRGLPQVQIDQMMNDWFTAHNKGAVASAKVADKQISPAKAAAPVVETTVPVIATVVPVAEVAEPEAVVAAEPAVEVAAETSSSDEAPTAEETVNPASAAEPS